jgi:ATP-dependent DNA ligase
MNLPVDPPALPMLAKRIDKLPTGSEWVYEPKWDGFRTLVFRDRKEILIQSRDEKPLNRYFPELIEPLLEQLPQKCVLDGEIVISRNGALDFEALQLRIHPAASRVKLLSQQTPASIVFFDLLAEDHDSREKAFNERRERLESILSGVKPPIHITPATDDLAVAQDWFRRFEGAGLDGVIAKAKDSIYESDKRTMFKVKHERDCDCVVAGFRWYRKGDRPAIGSLLLGLYDDSGVLQHVGVCGSFPLEKRYELVEYLKPYRENTLANHPWKGAFEDDAGNENGSYRRPGGQSRWSQGKDLSWEPLRLELVAEVAYEHMQSGRFRHMAQFRRWRFDKKPGDCTYEQLEVVPPEELKEIFPQNR